MRKTNYSTCPCCGSKVPRKEKDTKICLRCLDSGYITSARNSVITTEECPICKSANFIPVDFRRIVEAAKGMVDSWDTYRRGEYRFFEEDLKTLLAAIKERG